MSADVIQHEDGDLALGLAAVIGVGRPEPQRLFPQPRALLHLCSADLHVDVRVGEDVAVPAGVLRCAAFRGDDEIAVTGFPEEEWGDEPFS